MQDYLRQLSDIDANSLAVLTYRELCRLYQSAVWYAKIFRIYFNKVYYFHFDKKKNAKNFGVKLIVCIFATVKLFILIMTFAPCDA